MVLESVPVREAGQPIHDYGGEPSYEKRTAHGTYIPQVGETIWHELAA